MLAKLLALITHACLSNSVPSHSEVAGVNGYVNKKEGENGKNEYRGK
jgi:hypothetical protein